jgi:hypothetical protein
LSIECIEVRCDPDDAPLQSKPLRLKSEGFDVTRHRVVGLVAVHVDRQAAVCGDLA